MAPIKHHLLPTTRISMLALVIGAAIFPLSEAAAGSISGPNGGVAARGPRGRYVVKGPNGNVIAGRTAVRPPAAGVVVAPAPVVRHSAAVVLPGRPVIVAPVPAAPLHPAAVVISVQRRLSVLGYYNGAVDGIAGPITRAAIVAYQRRHGLASTGAINEALILSLQA